MIEFRIRDTGDLKRLSRDLRRTAEGKELLRELTRELRSILRPLVREVKASYAGGQHLRPLLAKATHMWVHTSGKDIGAGVMVDGRRMPNRMRKIPEYWEGEAPRWRHPLFGNREHWYDQSPRPTFYAIVATHEFVAEHGIEEAADRSLYRLRRG